jgi:hypothetical protein
MQLTLTKTFEVTMNELSLFGNRRSSARLADVADALTENVNSGSVNRRLSLEGNLFREIINGKELRVNEERATNVVIINAAPISKMYFAEAYVKGKPSKPTCWSSDSQVPDPAVPDDQRQSARCMDCRQAIKGSGQGDSKACKPQQRIAIVFEGAIEKREVYQLTLPPTSIFGDPSEHGGKMPLQAYARHLKAHGEKAIGIVTEMRFDKDSSTPKLVFKPVRPLDDAELDIALELRDAPDTQRYLKLNVSQMDKVIPAPALPPLFDEPKPEPKAKAKPKVEEVEEVIEEPKKVVSKKTSTAPQAEAIDMSDIVGDWDD